MIMPSQDSAPLATLDDLSTVDLSDVVDQTQKRMGHHLSQDRTHYSRANGTSGWRTAAHTWVRLSWRRHRR